MSIIGTMALFAGYGAFHAGVAVKDKYDVLRERVRDDWMLSSEDYNEIREYIFKDASKGKFTQLSQSACNYMPCDITLGRYDFSKGTEALFHVRFRFYGRFGSDGYSVLDAIVKKKGQDSWGEPIFNLSVMADCGIIEFDSPTGKLPIKEITQWLKKDRLYDCHFTKEWVNSKGKLPVAPGSLRDMTGALYAANDCGILVDMNGETGYVDFVGKDSSAPRDRWFLRYEKYKEDLTQPERFEKLKKYNLTEMHNEGILEDDFRHIKDYEKFFAYVNKEEK